MHLIILINFFNSAVKSSEMCIYNLHKNVYSMCNDWSVWIGCRQRNSAVTRHAQSTNFKCLISNYAVLWTLFFYSCRIYWLLFVKLMQLVLKQIPSAYRLTTLLRLLLQCLLPFYSNIYSKNIFIFENYCITESGSCRLNNKSVYFADLSSFYIFIF